MVGFLRNQRVLVGVYGAMVCWLVFTAPRCDGWFLRSNGVLANPSRANAGNPDT